ncbi:MAG TPA: metallophosphoesterase [bacterium]|nr:metallophosphoesterase [bacterium]
MSDTTTSRRRSRRALLLAAFVAGLALAVDALLVEPFRLEVTHHTLREPIAAPLTIAHVSDLHTCGLGRRERAVVAAINEAKPDVIVISGDTVTDWCKPEAQSEVLKSFHAPLGVWIVFGNWEHWHPVRHLRKFYEDAGVRLLDNENAQIRDDVWIAGFDDLKLGTPDLRAGLFGIPSGAFTLALFHSPAFFDDLAGHANLAFAGHTHGGQVRLPFLPPLWLPHGSGSYLEGWYERAGSKMYVSRGIGTSVLPIRFHCAPELAIIKLEPEPRG